jgi:hypothetical protein
MNDTNNVWDDNLSDEENNFNQWTKANYKYILENSEYIPIMKKIYIDGFVAGWLNKQRHSAQEYLQK